MKKQWVLTVLVLCLSLFFGSPHLSLAQDSQEKSDDTLTRLLAEGWKIVKDGVLQRELKPGEVESFVFGVPGFTWKIQDLRRQLQKLQAEFRANPTPELRKAIANHRKAIANAQRALEIARTSESLGVSDEPKVSCAINFSYDASAGPQTNVQGVWASASATFSANCGFTGQVYAYAFAKAWYNGAETTQTVTDGPRSGANVSASAYASRNGGSPCESYAYGEMVSYGLNPSSWSKSASSVNNCPPPVNPPGVTVTSDHATVIDLYEYDCVYITWTTNITPGTPPYSTVMYWNNSSLGSRTSYSAWVCNQQVNYTETITIRSDVTDSAGRTGSGSHTTTVRHHYYREYEPCGSNGQICP